MMDDAEIARLREIAHKATAGPWEHCQSFQTVPAERTIHGPVPAQRVDYVQGYVRKPHNGRSQVCIIPMEGRESFVRSSDMAHIASFDPPTVLALLDALEQARKERGVLEAERDMALAQVKSLAATARDCLAQRDAAQQDANEARALLEEVLLEWVPEDCRPYIRARIEAMLEKKL